jgi:hypothetical protein
MLRECPLSQQSAFLSALAKLRSFLSHASFPPGRPPLSQFLFGFQKL